MSFSNLYKQRGTVYRLATVSGGTAKQWNILQEDVPLNIQPGSEELIAIGEGDFYSTFTIYSSNLEDIKTGDKIRYESVDYLVRGIQDRGYGIVANHKKVSAIKK